MAIGLVTLTIIEAAEITVTTTSLVEDATDGQCSFFEALASADSNETLEPTCTVGEAGLDTIRLPAGTIGLPDTELGALITEPLTIVGQGPEVTVLLNQLLFGLVLDLPLVPLSLTVESLSMSGGATFVDSRQAPSSVTVTDVALRSSPVAIRCPTGGCSLTARNVVATDVDDLTAFVISTSRFSEDRPRTTADLQRVRMEPVSDQSERPTAIHLIGPVDLTLSDSFIGDHLQGMLVLGDVHVQIVNSTITAATAIVGDTLDFCGSLSCAPEVHVANSTILYESSGLLNIPGARATVTGSYFLKNSVLVRKPSSLDAQPQDCFSTSGEAPFQFTSQGHNILSENGGCGPAGPGDQFIHPEALLSEVLTPLAENGGPTPTFALRPDGPAVDAGNPGGCTGALGSLLLIDQRGARRTLDGDVNGEARCDVGAFEFEAPPVADAGADRDVGCSIPDGSEAILDGTGSFDPDGDPLTFAWAGPFPEGGGMADDVMPAVTLGLGMNLVSLVVSDGELHSDPDQVNITVLDTTAPMIQAGLEPILEGGDDEEDPSLFRVELECQDDCDSTQLDEQAWLNGIEVGVGQTLALHAAEQQTVENRDGILTIGAPSFELIATCTDSSGNTATAVSELTIPDIQIVSLFGPEIFAKRSIAGRRIFSRAFPGQPSGKADIVLRAVGRHPVSGILLRINGQTIISTRRRFTTATIRFDTVEHNSLDLMMAGLPGRLSVEILQSVETP